MTKAFLPHLLKPPEAHIAHVSSMGGFLPVPGQSIYGPSKAAVNLFTEGLHSELLTTNIRVTVIFPGAIGTNIAANSGVEISQAAAETSDRRRSIKPLEPGKAAEIIVDGLEQDRYRVMVGSDAALLDRFYSSAPSVQQILFSGR